MEIKKFEDYFKEDFNSPAGRELTVKVSKPRKSDQDVVVFYEKDLRTINLFKYMKSFTSDNSVEIFKPLRRDYWRACFYSQGDLFDAFVWRGDFLHQNIISSLEVTDSRVYPKRPYLRIYNNMVMINPNEPLPVDWCFPISFLAGGIQTNLSVTALRTFFSMVDVKTRFGITSIQMNGLINNGEIRV